MPARDSSRVVGVELRDDRQTGLADLLSLAEGCWVAEFPCTAMGLVVSVATGSVVGISSLSVEVTATGSSDVAPPFVCTVKWGAGLGRCRTAGFASNPTVWADAVDSDWAAAGPVFGASVLDSEESFDFAPPAPSPESASAIPWPVTTAPPIPRATANPPTRPTYAAEFLMLSPLLSCWQRLIISPDVGTDICLRCQPAPLHAGEVTPLFAE
jgi:hypothetical protein